MTWPKTLPTVFVIHHILESFLALDDMRELFRLQIRIFIDRVKIAKGLKLLQMVEGNAIAFDVHTLIWVVLLTKNNNFVDLLRDLKSKY